jgi:hypothetical protein
MRSVRQKCIFGNVYSVTNSMMDSPLCSSVPLCGKDFHAGDNVAVAEVTIVIQFLRS